MSSSFITCLAPVNIAVIKYWGKRDEHLILPLNDSVSVTLGTDEMHAKTTVMTNPKFNEDRIWLNGKEESIENPRLKTCLIEIEKKILEEKGAVKNCDEDRKRWKVHICSENNFPTAAGLASSAAGYACLVYALAKLYGLNGEISSVARMGSGSACRSVLGGFVRWKKGENEDGRDSVAEEIAPASHWPSMRILILVVNDCRKKTSSTLGMERSVLTSELLRHRVTHCVPQRTDAIIKAVEGKDFETFAEITMKDSNQFHSVCLDTYPPAVYMNDVSHSIVEFVHCYNKIKGNTRLAYTFDAGPNACLFLQEEDVPEVIASVIHTFPPLNSSNNFIRGLEYSKLQLNQDLKTNYGVQEPGALKYVILTKVGEGPKVLCDKSQHLIGDDGLPKHLTT